jgi:hypothetical protein
MSGWKRGAPWPAQAVDAARFVHDPRDPAVRAQALFAAQARAVLAQTPGHPVPLEEQVRACCAHMTSAACSLWPIPSAHIAYLLRWLHPNVPDSGRGVTSDQPWVAGRCNHSFMHALCSHDKCCMPCVPELAHALFLLACLPVVL